MAALGNQYSHPASQANTVARFWLSSFLSCSPTSQCVPAQGRHGLPSCVLGPEAESLGRGPWRETQGSSPNTIHNPAWGLWPLSSGPSPTTSPAHKRPQRSRERLPGLSPQAARPVDPMCPTSANVPLLSQNPTKAAFGQQA